MQLVVRQYRYEMLAVS